MKSTMIAPQVQYRQSTLSAQIWGKPWIWANFGFYIIQSELKNDDNIESKIAKRQFDDVDDEDYQTEGSSPTDGATVPAVAVTVTQSSVYALMPTLVSLLCLIWVLNFE